MAENSTPEERTELPTDRRVGDLRKEGTMPMSTDLVSVVSLVAGFLILMLTWEWLMLEVQGIMRFSFGLIALDQQFSITMLYEIIFDVAKRVMAPVLVISLVVGTCASLSVMLQTNWCVREKLIQFKLTSLNPVAGVKKVFSPQGAVNTLKSLFKLGLILPIGYMSLRKFAPEMIMLVHLTVSDVMAYLGIAIVSLFWKIVYVLAALAIFDYFWTKYQWLKQNKMTKDEVKDERKATEGDESTKRQIQSKGLGRIAQRIRESVPQADVVITNPTHYAIALKYDRESMEAPMILAKGKGFLALRIREIAKDSDVPILERKPLARALFHSTEVGMSVPYELFKAVAEVLAYVYKLRNPRTYS